MNRRTASCALSLVALFLVFAASQALASPETPADQDYSHARIVRLSYVEGDVQTLRPEETGWEDALLNLPIRQGYQISTRQGRAEIEFESGGVARLSDDTLLQFTELALSGGGRLTQLSLLRGTATFYVNLSSDDRFTLTTPHFTISVPRSARFRVDSGADGGTVTVHKGDVDVEAMGAPYHVTKNRAFLFRVEGDQVTLARAPDSDAWDHWVENRENLLNASHEAVSTRYARTSFTYGMYDLDYYGGWYSLPGYGRCWQPRGIGFGWSPYSFGQWVWLAGYGMTWVSFEPWGWTPYHYGNWIYLPGGWYWVPGGFNRWRPALVYWVNLGNNQWGWGPRHPHDIPGQPPNNLPHGTVLTTNNTPTGYGGIDRRLQRATPDEIARAQVMSEPPESAVGARLRGRGAVGTGSVDAAATAGAATTSGYSGTAKPQPTQPGDVARGDGITPRTRDNNGETGKPSGIVYDPQQHRWINSDVPGRTGSARTTTAETPAAPAATGYSGTTTTPAEKPAAPSTEIRRTDRGDVARDDSRLPGRHEQKDAAPAQGRPSPTPRPEAQQPQRPSSTPSQSQPRMETPRPASPPPPPPARVEPMRPASPPSAPAPSTPAPRSDSGGRPHTKPPGNR